ncbi:MAG: tRNA (adenosine(37)-N6)-threonylcarbamoyltransferase complex dimerization subunit type 1 TsaB [Candidatus Omnitrophica bacterium]|nr:tRNA (adenosine(37)-N6)-threonylcarbamoyltransferase complex dimerization subunit type 1 TsaB [Candidatus Omnitrophota bacterium]
MNILGFDTSSRMLAIVVGNDKGVLAARNINARVKHSVMIMPAIEALLKKAGLKKGRIDAVAAGLGPGSLTGIRIGVSTAKGLCLGLDRPAIGICSLDIIARNADSGDSDVCVLVDAKRSLVYSAVYRGVKRARPPRLSSLEDALRGLKPGTLFLGDAIGIYGDRIKEKVSQARFAAQRQWYPRAENILEIALSPKNRKAAAEKLVPLYLYPKECQIRK